MNQLRALFGGLTVWQKVSIVLTVAALAGGLTWLSRWNKERDFKPLYTSLGPEDAGAIAARLKEGNIEYRVSDAGSVLVPSSRVAEVRLQMAAAGLPKTGRIGYELFDKNNFGVTEFTEQINYHRALEGELERSVMAVREVEQARVHVTLAKQSLFTEQQQAAKASVMVKLRPGAALDPNNVLAITHLVASAVEGLTPGGVSVLDMNGKLLSRPRAPDSADGGAADSSLEYKQRIERDLLAKIHSTLDPLLGADRFRAGVSVDCDFTKGEQSEETFDPNRSVMVTSQKTEDISGSALASGTPGTASNLPRPPSRPGSGAAGITRRTENISYQSSRVVRRVQLPQGGLKRISVSLLLDHAARWEGAGPKAKLVLEPPSAEKIKIIRDLITGAAGLVTDRGDQLIVESLPFERTLNATPPSPALDTPRGGTADEPAWLRSLRGMNGAVFGGIGAGVLLTCATLLFLLRRRGKKSLPAPAEAPKALAARPEPAITEEGIRKQIESQLAGQAAEKERQLLDSLASLQLPSVKTQKTEVLVKHIGDGARKDPQLVANVLRTWMNDR